MNTISASRGRSRETSLRLCSRAPRTMSRSVTRCPVTVAVNILDKAWDLLNPVGSAAAGAPDGFGANSPVSLTTGTDNHFPIHG